MNNRKFTRFSNSGPVLGSLLAGLAFAFAPAHAAQTDISSLPMASTTSAQVKPNIMLLMDTSGSMGWGHMPDEVENVMGINSIGYKSVQCNPLYYNPALKYELPKQANGTLFPAPGFSNAPYAGYVAYYASPDATDLSTVNLGTSFRAFDSKTLRVSGSVDTAQPAYYYVYSGTATLNYATVPCTDPDTSAASTATTGGTWTRKVVSSTSGPASSDERQNFANWYSFYRTRISMIKSAASLSFTPLTDSFRVGFITMQPTKDSLTAGTVNPNKYLAINDFDSTQRSLWFTKLFSQIPGGSSPAREGLARVGRHYAGKSDGINTGMTGDPVQYSCQQNFTIMTTDGYWNSQDETTNKGPVQLDGSTLVGQQDGSLTLDSGLTPRPIYDGLATSVTTVEDNRKTYSYGDCGGLFYRGTTQLRQSTTQTTAATSQLTSRTSQINQSTLQLRASTSQITRSTSQLMQDTVQLQRSTAQVNVSTAQISRNTSQIRQSTSQIRQSTSQVSQSTSQVSQSTSQLNIATARVFVSTSQILSCNASTELCTPVPIAGCTPGGFISCDLVTTGPTADASCTPQTANAGNSYTTTTCSTTTTGPTAAASCTPAVAGAGNGYVTTTCPTVVTGPTLVTSCTAALASFGNSYTATTCSTVATGPTPVASCTPAAASSGNSYTATTCSTATTGPTPAASCTAVAANAGNSYTATTCNTANTGPTGVSSCTPVAANSGNSYTATTCGTNLTGPTLVATCTPQSPSSGNSWTTRTCNTVTTGPTPTATCSPAAASAGNSYTSTTCSTNTTTPVDVATCTPVAASAGNSWTATVCSNRVITSVGVLTCTPSGPSVSGVSVVCRTATTGPTGVASCTPISPTAGNGYRTTTCNTVTTGPTLVAACTNAGATSANLYTATTCSSTPTGPTPVASCTAAAPTALNAYTQTTCNTVATAPAGVASCTPVAASGANSYTATLCNTVSVPASGVASCTSASADSSNAYTSTTCATVATGPTLVATCTAAAASAGNAWTTTTCDTTATSPTVETSCTPQAADASNGYTATTCTAVLGKKIQFATTRTVTTTRYNLGTIISGPSTATTTSALTDVTGTCYAPGTEPALPVPNPEAMGGPFPGACTAWPCTTSAGAGPGSENSLADVAQYYYVTDLRPEPEWATIGVNNVPAAGSGSEDDRATWQHMTTFTLGMGVSGTLTYQPDYRSLSVTAGDFADIRTGAKNWPLFPDPNVNYDGFSGGSFDNWNDPRSIDDFWHTAVNGRGQYFSADRPTSVVSGLNGALAGVSSHLAGGASAGASNFEPVAGDNFVYLGTYTTNKWTGDVRALEVDLETGAFSTSAVWSAQPLLDAKTSAACDNRNIYLLRGNSKVNFTWNTRVCDSVGLPFGAPDSGLNASEQAHFGALKVSLFSHYPSMSDGTAATANQRTLAAGANLVNYLRGQRGLEGFEINVADKLYRARDHVLGDVINAQPVYVKAPFAYYSDAGYSAFKTAIASRTPMVYVAANDGMLHAFYAGTSTTDPLGGQEAWAVIPSAVLPNLYKLADTTYAGVHQFFVDGTPSLGDVFDASTSSWKTILVGGLNAGGKGYYAIDVTDPASPQALWEFNRSSTCYSGTPINTDCNIGYSFGQPVISKLANGTWVVMVTSGFNNVSGSLGDGGGYLYVLNAITGEIIHKIATGVGDATTPSGLTKISNYVDNTILNNTTQYVYGGDLLGNVWRFEVNASTPAAILVGTAKDASGTPQPITIKPELTELNGLPMVFVGTGRLLGASDMADTQGQSVYGIVDTLSGGPVYPNLRTALKPMALTRVSSTDPSQGRTVACTGTTVQCGSTSGWVIDLPDAGERVNVDMKLALGTLLIGSNVPQSTACLPGGYSWLNMLNFATGLAIPGELASRYEATALIVGVSAIRLPAPGSGPGTGGLGSLIGSTCTSLGTCTPRRLPTSTPPPVKRITWREISQ